MERIYIILAAKRRERGKIAPTGHCTGPSCYICLGCKKTGIVQTSTFLLQKKIIAKSEWDASLTKSHTTLSGHKKNYKESVGPWFIDERINKEHATQINNFVGTNFAGGEKLRYSTPVIKYDRHGYKPRERFFLLSDRALYLLDAKTYKVCTTMQKMLHWFS